MKLDEYGTLTLSKGEELRPCSLYIFMTRGKSTIREFALRQFGPFERIVINIDGEEHSYDAEKVISLLERYEEEGYEGG